MDKDTIEYICENIGKTNYLIVALLFGLGLNLVITIAKICLDFALKNKEKHNHKANLIAEKAIVIHKEIFDEIVELTLFDRNEIPQLCTKISVVRGKVQREKIYFNKPLLKTVNNILDYFLIVAVDFSKKDLKAEESYLNTYSKQFNG